MKKLDWSKKLSDEDRAWALQFDHLRAQVEENDRQFSGEQEQSRAERMEELRATISGAQTELARLEAEEANEGNENRAMLGDPATGQVILDNTGVDGETPEGAPAPAETYDGWKADDLKAEIRKRNKEREAEGLDPLPTTGRREELVERLLADDREIAESQA